MGNKIIEVKNLIKSFGNHTVLNDISIDFEKGDVVCIVGPSGGGKSTFLRSLNLLETPTSGHIYIEGVDITDKNNNIDKIREKEGMVFQHFNLFPHLTIIDNMTLAPMKVKKIKKEDAEKKAVELLVRVGLEDKKNTYPDMLSGGQKQRVAIVRSLMMEPDILLFDEPTSALDPEMVGEVSDVIKGLTEMNLTMLIVTHEMGFAREVANRILFLNDGSFEFDGTPKKFFEIAKTDMVSKILNKNPKNERVKAFLNKVL